MEQTGTQLFGVAHLLNALSMLNSPQANYNTYRSIRKNPTVMLARAVSNAPILKSYFTVSAREEVDERVTNFISDVLEGIWPEFIKTIVLAKDYGFQSYEKVWGFDPSTKLMKIERMKPLVPDTVEIQVNNYGDLTGIKQKNVILEKLYCFVYTHQMEGSNFYGESQMESIMHNAWIPWVQTAAKLSSYTTKVASTIPILRYPPGKSKDANGAERDNFEIATMVLSSLGKGNGVAMPQELLSWAFDLARGGIDPKQWASWTIDFLETGTDHGAGMINSLRHYESLMMRGWLVPERTALEGQYGTKAEASEHADIALEIASLWMNDVFESFNKNVVNDLLVVNFGQELVDKVWIEQSGIDASIRAMMKRIVESILTAPSNIDLVRQWVKIDAIFDELGIPKTSDELDTAPEETEEPSLDDILNDLKQNKDEQSKSDPSGADDPKEKGELEAERIQQKS